MAKTKVNNDGLQVGQVYADGGWQWEIERLGQYFVTFKGHGCGRKYKRDTIAQRIRAKGLKPIFTRPIAA